MKIPRAIESIATEAASRVRTTSSRPPEELTLLGTLIAKLKLQGKRGGEGSYVSSLPATLGPDLMNMSSHVLADVNP